MKLFKSDRCKRCKTHPGHRFCIRTAKDICWHCCNELRLDGKCPDTCRYTPKKRDDEIFATGVKVESRSEFRDFLKKMMKRWAFESQSIFDGRIPIKMAENKDQKAELETIVNQLQAISELPVDYLADLLNIRLEVTEEKSVSHEQVGNQILRTIIAQDWDILPKFLRTGWTNGDPVLVENFIQRMQSDSNIKHITSFDLIASALSDNNREALIQYEVNGKVDLTLHLLEENGEWKLESRTYGKLEIYRDLQQIMNQAALYLQKSPDSACWEYINKFLKFYPDSADLQYDMGMYQYFNRNTKRARIYLMNAVEIDGSFTEARYALATILQTSDEPQEAERHYRIVLEQNPDDFRAMNNIATIMIDSDRKEEAKKLLLKCLAIQPEFEMAQKNLERLSS